MKPVPISTRLTGAFFIIPFLAYGLGDQLITFATDTPHPLALIADSPSQIVIGCLLLLLNAIVIVGIGALLFPVLARTSKTVAVAYLSTRMIEATVLIIGIIANFSLIVLAKNQVEMSLTDTSFHQTFFVMARSIAFWSYQVAMIILGIGSIVFCGCLLRAKLLPVSISVLGIVGYSCLLIGSVLECFDYRVGVIMAMPGGIFELILGLCLVFKGFNNPVISRLR